MPSRLRPVGWLFFALLPAALVVVGACVQPPAAPTNLAVSAARPLYSGTHADRLMLVIQENTPHRVNAESFDAGVAWFIRWLRP